MTNFSSIITLLQLVLALLSNPTTAQNPQTQALTTQIIGLATQALQQATTTVTVAPIDTSTPITQPSQPQQEAAAPVEQVQAGLSITPNQSFPDQTYSTTTVDTSINVGTPLTHIGSYTLTANGGNYQLSKIMTTFPMVGFQNAVAVINGSRFGVTAGGLNGTVTFENQQSVGSGVQYQDLPITIPNGSSVTVDLYAQVIHNAQSVNPATTITGYNDVTLSQPIIGQGLTISN